jgi:hypothetical protein
MPEVVVLGGPNGAGKTTSAVARGGRASPTTIADQERYDEIERQGLSG